MSNFSVAIWDKLPPLNEQLGKVHRHSELKGKVNKKDYDVLTPKATHFTCAPYRRALAIMDSLVTRIMLASSFETIFKYESVR